MATAVRRRYTFASRRGSAMSLQIRCSCCLLMGMTAHTLKQEDVKLQQKRIERFRDEFAVLLEKTDRAKPIEIGQGIAPAQRQFAKLFEISEFFLLDCPDQDIGDIAGDIDAEQYQ